MPGFIPAGGGNPSPTTGSGDWVRATSPSIATPTFTGAVTVGAGTAGAPSIVATGATTTGPYITATPSYGVSLGGTAKFLIEAAGVTFPTTGSATALTIDNTYGNTGLGTAPNQFRRLYIDTSSKSYGIDIAPGAGVAGLYSEQYGAVSVDGYSLSSVGIRGGSRDDTGVHARQLGTLSMTSAAPTLIAERISTIGAFDFTGPVVLVEDTTASTGNLQRWRKGGADVAVLTPLGAVVLGGGTISTKAILDLQSTTLGFLPPRMTTTQRDAITSVPAGLTIFNTTTAKLNVYTTAWEAVTSA